MKVLITGASGGIGFATACELARRGHHVVAGVLNASELDAYEGVSGVETLLIDITKEEDRAAAAVHAPDVLINNAAVGMIGPLALFPMDRVRALFEVNVFATLEMTQAVVPAMLARGSGRIVIVSSVAGVRASAMAGPYAMSKHALQAMGSSLRAELEPQGIDVVLANPGAYGTGFNDRMVASVREWLKPEDAAPYEPFIERMSGIITVDQMDPAGAGPHMADLCEAKETKLVNPIPPGLF